MLCPLLSRQQVDPSTGKSEWTHLECLGAECKFYNVPEADCQFLLASRDGNVHLPSASDRPGAADAPSGGGSSEQLLPLLESVEKSLHTIQERLDSGLKEADGRLRDLEKTAGRLAKSHGGGGVEDKLEELGKQIESLAKDSSSTEGDSLLPQVVSRLEMLENRHSELLEAMRAKESSTEGEESREGIPDAIAGLAETLKIVDSAQQEALHILRAFREVISSLPSRHEELVERFGSTLEEALKEQTQAVGTRLAEEMKVFGSEQRERLESLGEEAVRNNGRLLQTLKKNQEEQDSSLAALAPRLEEIERSTKQNHESLDTISGSLAELRSATERGPERLESLQKQLEELIEADRKSAQGAQQRVEALGGQVETVGRSLGQMAQVIKALQEGIDRANDSLGSVRTENKSLVLAFHEQKMANQEELKRRNLEQARELNSKGVALFHRGSIEAAIEAFIRAVELKPDHAEAYNNLGLAYSKRGQNDEAVKYFQKALELDPQMGEVYNNLGFLFHTTTRFDRAIEMFNRSLQTGADQAIAYTNLGNSFYQMKQNDKAVAAWKKALEIDPLNETARRGLSMFQQEPPPPAASRS